jgi:hypothetical protein
MATGDYTTLANAKIVAALPSDDTSWDALINLFIPILSRMVDDHCHRHFYAIEEERTFDFQGYWKMWLRGDLHSLTSITCNDGTVLDNVGSTQLFLRPQAGPPYRWVEVNRAIGIGFRYLTTPQDAIVVDGTWGYLQKDGTQFPQIGLAVDAWMAYLMVVSANRGIQSETIGDHTKSFANVFNYLKNGPPNEVSGILSHFIYRDIVSPVHDPMQSQADITPPWYNQLGQFDKSLF